VKEIVYLNGDLIPGSRAMLSPFDHGFLYGYGLFETMRAYNGTIFRLGRHLARLQQSAEILNLARNWLLSTWQKPATMSWKPTSSLKPASGLPCQPAKVISHRTRLPAKTSTVFVVARKLVPLPPETYQNGFKAALSSWRRTSGSPLSAIKSTSCLDNVLAKQEARAAGADEALLLNQWGFVAEGASSNIFLIRDKKLITPSLESGTLPGITREVVLEQLNPWG